MKINTGKIIVKLNGDSCLEDTEPNIVDGKPIFVKGPPLTVGSVLSTLLTVKKQEQFNTLKAYALAQRFYKKDSADIDDSDFSALRDIVEKNEVFIPLVTAQTLQALIDAKDKVGGK